MAKYLDQEKVTQYVLLGAEMDRLKAKKEELRLELIEGFEEGLKCPKEGPYLLVLTEQRRTNISWKDEFAKIAKEFLGKSWVKRRKEIETSAPKTKVPMLLPKVNPRYEAPEKVTNIRSGKGAA